MDSFPKGDVSTVTRALSGFDGFMALWIDFLLYTYTGKIRSARALIQRVCGFSTVADRMFIHVSYIPMITIIMH